MDSAAELWAVVLANGYRREDIEAWLLALIGPRHCRHCGVELPRPLRPGRPRVWCDAHRTAAGRRAISRVCLACGASLDGRRRQATTCSGRCRQRLLRARRGAHVPRGC